MKPYNDLTEKEAAEMRLNYPPKTRILLEYMEATYPVPVGTRGTVNFVDDEGTINVRWDNGRTLTLIPKVDRFRKLTKEELMQEQNVVIQARGMEEMSL